MKKTFIMLTAVKTFEIVAFPCLFFSLGNINYFQQRPRNDESTEQFGHVRARRGSAVMSTKVGTCLAIKSSSFQQDFRIFHQVCIQWMFSAQNSKIPYGFCNRTCESCHIVISSDLLISGLMWDGMVEMHTKSRRPEFVSQPKWKCEEHSV